MNFYIQKYKKWLVLLLCISFLIPQNVGLNTVLAATKGVCTATKLMIRQGPGTDYAPVKVGGEDAYLVTNQVVDIISSEKGWYKLKAKFNGTDVEGYSSGAYIKEAANAGDTDVKTTQKGICTAATLMIRTGPATTYASVTVNGVAAYLTNGQSVEILGSENGWYKIKTVFGATEIEGYSSGSYISVVGTDAKITVTAAPAATEKPAATPAATEKPAATPKVTATPKPTSKPMATPKPTATPAPVYELKVSAKISATTLNVRETAGKSGKLLTTLSKGTAVTVIGETKSGTEIWYKVTVKVEKKTITGYVLSDYVTLTVGNGFYGNILQNNITPVTVAGGNKAVKLADGSFWMVNKGNTWISEEVIVSGVKWFRIGQNIGGTAYRGYVTANKVELLGKKLPTPTPAKTPEPTAAVTPKPTAQPTKAPVPDTSKLDPEEDFEIPAEVIATSLNVRSKASTSSDILATLTQGHQLTVLNEADAGNETWYRVAVTVDKKLIIGYVYEPYVKFVLTLPVEALIAGSKMKVKSKPDTNSANLTGTDKAEIVLNKGIKVSIVEDVKVDYVRWLGIQFTLSNKEYKGYVTVNQIDLLIPTAAPTPSAAPTPTETPTPSATPTVEPTKAPTPTPALTTNRAVIKDAAALVIRQEAGYSGNIVSDSAGSAVLLRTGQELMLLSVKKVDGILWYQTSFQYGNGTYTGYVNEKYVELKEPDASFFPNASPTPVPTVIPVDDKDFEASLTAQKFPESYKPYLRELHSMYPNWKFVAYHTGLDWNTVLDNEGIAGTNLIPNSKGIEWKSLGAGAYNWKTDSFIVYDGSTWVTASREAIAYYMDPRNFLTENGIFQFEVLTYQTAYQNLEGVESILNNTPLYKTKYTYTNDTGQAVAATYAETFIKAAEYSGVSPYHLASRVKQEVVTGTTSVSNSVTGTVAGFEGMYNFYNIGAYHSTAPGGAIANGLKYAKNGTTNAALNLNSLIPWDNRYSAIVGGAYIIGNSYINKGQDTIYLQKFNVTSVSTYAHQYMANVEAPYAEAKKVFTAYSNVSELPIVFSIPVYLNMPSKAAVIPATKRNPNNWLSTLKVTDVDGKDLILTPTFDISIDQEYNLVVGSNVEMINVVATAVSKKATVSGNGFYSLSTGKNLVLVYVIAEDGSIREYKINIVRE